MNTLTASTDTVPDKSKAGFRYITNWEFPSDPQVEEESVGPLVSRSIIGKGKKGKFCRVEKFSGTHESLYPRNITFMGDIEISIKNHQKWHRNKRISPKFYAIAKVYTREISEMHHSQKFIPAKVNFGPRRSQKFYPRESFYQQSSELQKNRLPKFFVFLEIFTIKVSYWMILNFFYLHFCVSKIAFLGLVGRIDLILYVHSEY